MQLATLAEVIRAAVASSNNRSNEPFVVYVVLPQSEGMGWWDINFAEYMFAMAMGEAEKARVLRQTPSGVPECRRRISRLVRETRALYAPPDELKGGAEREWFRAADDDDRDDDQDGKGGGGGGGGGDLGQQLLSGIQSMVSGGKGAEELEKEEQEEWERRRGDRKMFPADRVFFMGFSQVGSFVWLVGCLI